MNHSRTLMSCTSLPSASSLPPGGNLVILLLLLFTAPLLAWDEKKANLGGLEGFVERMGGGIRELGRGNTGVADDSAMPGAFWNPAFVAASHKGIPISIDGEQRNLGRAGMAFGIQSGLGSRMGVGFALLTRGVTDFEVIDEDENNLGNANPYFYMAYLSVGWRASRKDLIGLSFSKSGENFDLEDKYEMDWSDGGQSPTSYNIGWHRQWLDRWETGIVIRNLGFNSDLTARWTRSPTRDNMVASTETFRPKTLEMGALYHGNLQGQRIDLHLEILDYQLVDTLLAFDPDRHYWTARWGVEWAAFRNGKLRAGMDSRNLTLGCGYRFDLRWNRKPWPLDLDWALVYESQAGLWNPISVGVRTRIP